MPVQRNPQPQALNHDSFLDIVANTVGIMIVLVMLVSLRVKNAPVETDLPPELQQLEEAVRQQRAIEAALRDDVLRLATEHERVQRDGATRAVERNMLGTLVASLEFQLAQHREQLDAHGRQQFDLRRELAQQRQRLAELQRASEQLASARPDPTVIHHHPTPLSQPVDAEEIHFQLQGGLVAYIPLEELVRQFKADVLRQVNKLRDLTELSGMVGPEGGFRLRYTMERKEIPLDLALASGRGGAFAQLKHWTLLPDSPQLGETVEEALAEGSAFRRVLGRHLPGRSTITLWVYSDSFPVFRRLREELYQRGYRVAARPLPDGVPISGSPEGSKSAAQ
jgi:hypothetical protein